MMINVGDVVEIAADDPRSKRIHCVRVGTVVYVGERYVTLDYGNYRESFMLGDFEQRMKWAREGVPDARGSTSGG
jgi:hypothetical protein